MGRKGTLYSILLILTIISAGCSGSAIESLSGDGRTRITVRFITEDGGCSTRGDIPPSVQDISLLVFDRFGKAEENISATGNRHVLELVSGETYSFYACADFGYQVYAEDISEMADLTYSYTGFLDGGPGRMPRCAVLNDVLIEEGMDISMELENLLVKVTLVMDKSQLDEDVRMDVTGLDICNCPIYTYVFRSQEKSDGDSRHIECRNLRWPEKADSLELYVPEEQTDSCCHLEINLDYLSYKHFTGDRPLIYRLHIGEEQRCTGVRRNFHHRITVSPVGDGLSLDGWRVDKSGLHEFGPSGFASFPESYIRGDIGDTLHLWCEFYPPHAQFDVGVEELEYDKDQGIYDYIIDEDGHGVRLILTGPGSGLVYMRVGEPVNEAALWVIEVNLPDEEYLTDTSPYGTPCMTSTGPEFRQTQDAHLRHQPQARDLSPSQLHG